jgi:hypothetical protein
VAADQAGLELEEVPLGAGRREHVAGVYAHALEDERELVHQGDVEVALGVLDHLGRLRDLDGGGAMDAGGDHALVDPRDDVEDLRVLAGHHLGDLGEGVFLVARVDALGRITDEEVAAADQAGMAFQHRHAVLLGRARVHRRLEDHDVASLELLAEGLGGAQHRGEIGPLGIVDRGRHGDDVEIRRAQVGRIGGVGDVGRRELRLADFERAVPAALEFGDARPVDVEADGAGLPSEGDRHRQADVAQAHYRDLSAVRTHGIP